MTVLCITALLLCADVGILRDFQSPDTVSDEYIGDPYSMHFAPDGGLYLVDRLQATVHRWAADGTYLGRFGSQGEGPGELFYPVKVCAAEKVVWVWDFHRRLSRYTPDGTFLDSIALPRIEPKTFAVLGDAHFLFGYRDTHDAQNIRFLFELADQKGQAQKTLLEVRNDMFLPARHAEKDHVKAFGPQGDIQQDPDGTVYFGYGRTPEVYRINQKGEVLGKTTYALPERKPLDGDKEIVGAMDVPSAKGGRLALTDLLDFNFDHPMAAFTHFLVKGDRIAFILTPVGGLGVLNAYHRGDYVVCDLHSGAAVARGAFNYPVDSRIFFRDGRALAVVNEKNGYTLHEITLKGL